MAVLDVTLTTDFSGLALNDVTNINFLTAGNSTAAFTSSQFNNVAIHNDVIITGSAFGDRILVNGGGIDASAWQFVSWTVGSDRIRLNGSGAADSFVGSRMKDTINGFGGADIIVSGHSSQADVFNGGAGNDTFRYLGFTSPITDTIIGGAGLGDRIEITEQASHDFTGASISGVERLIFGSFDQTATFDAGVFGLGGIVQVSGSVAASHLVITGANTFSLQASVAFTGWGAEDDVTIIGTAGADDIRGAAGRDIIEGGGGGDALSGKAGDDDFVFSTTVLGGSISGAAGHDAIVVYDTGFLVNSLQNVTISSVEEVRFDARGGTGQVVVQFDGSTFATSGITSVTGSTEIDSLGVIAVAANGFVADASQITFGNWDELLDKVVLIGSDLSDDVLIGAGVSTSFTLTDGADIVTGGVGDDRLNVQSLLTSSGFAWDGGDGMDTLTIGVQVSGILTLTGGTISNIETLDLGSSQGAVDLDASNFGSTGFQTVRGGNDFAANTVIVRGSVFDLSAVALADWGASDNFDIRGTDSADVITGTQGRDTFLGTDGGDQINGSGGIDTINFGGSSAGVVVSFAAGTAAGGYAAGDILSGLENLVGSGLDDVLTGAAGVNNLTGGAGDDVLDGRQGADVLTGGAGDDTYFYSSTLMSRAGSNNRDVIFNYSQIAGDDDVIDLSAIDANTGTGGNNTFSFVGTITGAGQIQAVQSGGDTIIQINTGGTLNADMEIVLQNFTATNITAADFIL